MKLSFEVTSLLSLYLATEGETGIRWPFKQSNCASVPVRHCTEGMLGLKPSQALHISGTTQWICAGGTLWVKHSNQIPVCLHENGYYSCRHSRKQPDSCSASAGCGRIRVVISERLVSSSRGSTPETAQLTDTEYKSRAPYLGTGIPASQTRPCSKQNMNII